MILKNFQPVILVGHILNTQGNATNQKNPSLPNLKPVKLVKQPTQLPILCPFLTIQQTISLSQCWSKEEAG